MNKAVEELQDSNTWILTSVNGVAVFMHKDSPHYTAKANDRIVSQDCVVANESRLIEVTAELNLPQEWGVFALTE
jgi:hypothetical protein|tara:strand:- start:5 stop:229 length:225 start_codon:yes stop_codon:yes gene_type:complete